MTGLCEGGNEPPDSLKAISESAPSSPWIRSTCRVWCKPDGCRHCLAAMTPVSVSALQPAYARPPQRGWQALLWAQVCDYCENTTLHGYRYLTEPGRHWVE
ncbi:hypothetical protein ANN_25988, partial [Periplaneta americana]